MKSDDSGTTRIGPEAKDQPAWSPDGTKIAYKEGDLVSAEVWVMDAEGTVGIPSGSA